MKYVRINSWHVVWRELSATVRTRCGIAVSDSRPRAEELPLDEKSCETCLRLTRRDEEKESGT